MNRYKRLTVAAVYEGVNELESSAFSPLLASPQGGVAASSRKFRVATDRTQPGWFTFYFDRKASRSADAARYYLIAQPPLAVMQGGDYHGWI
jgi:hypothetical protein